MSLISNVKLILDDEPLERVSITNAVKKSDVSYLQKGYAEKSIIPNNNWEQISFAEKDILIELDENDSFSNVIRVLPLSNNLIDKICEMGIPNVEDSNNLQKLLSENENNLKELYRLIEDFLSPLYYEGQERIFHGFCINSPNLTTVTYINKDGLKDTLMGMHIDNSNRFNYKESDIYPNRISMNFSFQDRYLLFVNLTVEKICEMIRNMDKDVNLHNLSCSEIVYLFFSYYPNYPILRLRQNKFEAYIAPTENIIHDGSTLGLIKPDITFIMRGYLNPFVGL